MKAAAAVDCPVPPRAMLNWPVHPKVRFCAVIEPVTLVSLLIELTVVLGSRAVVKTPEVILAALVVSVVAEATKEVPLVFVQVTALEPEVVQSPDNSADATVWPPLAVRAMPVAGLWYVNISLGVTLVPHRLSVPRVKATVSVQLPEVPPLSVTAPEVPVVPAIVKLPAAVP